MKAELTIYFRFKHPFDNTTFEPFKKLGGENLGYNKEDQKFTWQFPIDKVKQVRELGINIIFDNYDETKEVIFLKGWKGKSGLDITEFPLVFIITIYRKNKDTMRINQETHIVEKALLDKVWTEWKKVPLNRKLKASTIGEKICIALGITRFHRGASGTFDWAKFFGERHDYFKYYYYPMKILEHKGVILYGAKSSIRIKDTLEYQKQFTETVVRSDEI